MIQPTLFETNARTKRSGSLRPVEAGACRRMGKRHADRTLGPLEAKLLQLYFFAGWTDAEAARHLGVERTTVIGRRDALVKQGHAIVQDGTRINPRSGKPNAVWRLKKS